MNRVWRKVDELSHSFIVRERELDDQVDVAEAKAAEAEKALVKANKSFEDCAKKLKETEQERHCHKKLADNYFELASNLQNDLKADTEKYEQLEAQKNEELEKQKVEGRTARR